MALKVTGNNPNDQLEGAWLPQWSTSEDVPTAEEDLRNVTLTFEDGLCTVLRGKKLIRRGTYIVDPTRVPKTLDVCFTESDVIELIDKPMKGIFERNGEILQICYGPPGGPRARTFSAEKGTGKYLGNYRLIANLGDPVD